MRVLQIAPDTASTSGIAAFAAKLRAPLLDAGVEVEPVPVRADPSYKWTDVRAFARRALDASRRGYDAVHVELSGGALHEFHAARVIARDGRTPVFLTVHDPPRPVWTPFHVRPLRGSRVLRGAGQLLFDLPARRSEREVVAGVRGIFTLSELGLRAIERAFGALDSRGCVLAYPAAARLAERPAREADERLIVGFFGHWYPGKGLATLVGALGRTAADADPVRARLWGEPWADGTYAEGVRRLVEGSPARDLIELPGFLPDRSLEAEIGACDVVALPYDRRLGKRSLASVSAALFDVLSTGTPVVVSDVRSLAEAVEDGRNGLVVAPGDDVALANALRRLRDDRQLLARLREGARESALTRSPRKTAEQVARHYERCLGSVRG
jgi:glycosyltransferase involved in cell wall biosynthesis